MIFIGAISVDFVANLLGQREDAYLMNAPLLFLKRLLLALSSPAKGGSDERR